MDHNLKVKLRADDFAKGFVNSQTRVESARCRMADDSTLVTLESLKDLFSARDDPDFPISYHYDVEAGILGFTAVCSIYEIPTDGPPLLHLAAGPPDITAFRTFGFE